MMFTSVNPIKARIKKACHAFVDAWWVFLLIILYAVFAHFFLGGSCLVASTTGFPCPGCGGTRALISLFRGDFLESLKYHPLLLPALIILLADFVFSLVKGQAPRWFNRVLVALAVATAIVYAARLILLFPHTEPMKYNRLAVLPRVFFWIRSIFPS